jgi:hypothetical protein
VIAVSLVGWWHVLLVLVAAGIHVFWIVLALVVRRVRRGD